MSTDAVVVLVAASITGAASIVLLLLSVGLRRQVRELRDAVDELHQEAVPLVNEARRAVDQANGEMERVGQVLQGTEAVTATVDQASRLAYRAFANPVVKVLAIRAGTVGGFRRFREDGVSGSSASRRRSEHRRPTSRARYRAGSDRRRTASGR